MLWKSVDMLKQDLGLLSVQWSTQRQVGCVVYSNTQNASFVNDRVSLITNFSCRLIAD